MKKLFLFIAIMLLFSACLDPKPSQGPIVAEDSIEVVVDTAKPITIDTTRCYAITAKGEQCKNHPVTGDTLCSIHKKMR